MNSSIQFLLYAYFGIAKGDSEDKMLISLINRAYVDASSHVLSFKEGKEKKRDDCKKEAVSLIKERLSELENCEGDQSSSFDSWHKTLCDDLVKKYPAESAEFYKARKNRSLYSFSYGTAQKWVNMTLKYCVILHDLYDLLGEEKDLKVCSEVNKYKKHLHVPLDSYMLSAIRKELGADTSKADPWSKIKDYKDYLNLQKAIRDNIDGKVPFDWEGDAWIRTAKIEKDKEMNKKYEDKLYPKK